ncbi:MAG: hypothetical protein H7833_17025 [Magnetococcus sp. DMHC-1]|nr:hypothetical protein [Magnetococcales bacterium]
MAIHKKAAWVTYATALVTLPCLLWAGSARAGVEAAEGGVIPMAEKQGSQLSGQERVGEYELICWQEGKEIFRESGFGQTFFSDKLNPQIVPTKTKDGRHESIQIIPFQNSLCRLKKNWK